MSTQRNHALNWHELHDEHGRPYWEAVSIYHDDGSPFCFRIRKFGALYREASDAELMSHAPRRTWRMLEEAKGDLQREHERMIHAETHTQQIHDFHEYIHPSQPEDDDQDQRDETAWLHIAVAATACLWLLALVRAVVE